MSDVIWINASAGSGKTKKIIDRIIFLLLNGILPSEILCVTFTKAAASEMESRLFSMAQSFATLTMYEFKEHVSQLNIINITSAFEIAKKLKDVLIKNPVNIKTLHSFANTIIERYSYKYLLDKNFKVINDSEKEFLIKASLQSLIKKEYMTKSFLDNTLNILSKYFSEDQLFEIINHVLLHKNFFKKDSIQILREYEKRFGVKLNTRFIDKDNFLKLVLKPYEIDFRKFCTYLGYDEKFSQQLKIINNFLVTDRKVTTEFIDIFFTKDYRKRKIIVAAKDQKIQELSLKLQDRVGQALEQYFNYENAIVSYSLYILLKNIIDIYQNLKQSNNEMDYDDIIQYAIEILKSETHKEILYKIDADLKHVLVDEAQDTNPYQWEIIKLITEEFFYIDNKNDGRSVFIVGDQKQSIYSFQGVDICDFISTKEYFKSKVRSAGGKWQEALSNTSYRTNSSILQVIDNVCNVEDVNRFIFAGTCKKIRHNAFNGLDGYVELYPITKRDEHDNAGDVSIDNDQILRHSKMITDIIQSKLQEYIPSKNRKAEAGDFFVLFQKRSDLMIQLANDLRRENIKVSDIDKVKISESVIVSDLITLAKFIVCKNDDMNTAILLKSPFFAISEDELFKLSTKREGKFLYDAMRELNPGLYVKLSQWLQLANNTTIYEFFMTLLECEGYTEVFCARFGDIARNIIENFLDLILEYESFNESDFTKFCVWMLNRTDEFKTDSSSDNEVKLMTVHASKGLEAPFIILADANVCMIKADKCFFDKGLFIYTVNGKGNIANELLENDKYKQLGEYYRLMYVAMTRVKDALIITGMENRNKKIKTWYDVTKSVMDVCAEENNMKDVMHLGQYFNIVTVDKSFETEFHNNLKYDFCDFDNFDSVIINKNIEKKYYSEEGVYGQVFHDAVRVLNDSKSILYACNFIDNCYVIEESAKSVLKNRINAIYENFNWFFSRHSYSEVPFIIEQNYGNKEGRIDLLIDNEDNLQIIDFKLYKKEVITKDIKSQMRFYYHAVKKMTNKNVNVYIFWVNSLRLEEIRFNN